MGVSLKHAIRPLSKSFLLLQQKKAADFLPLSAASLRFPAAFFSLNGFFHQADDFPFFGMTLQLLFGENQLTVHFHFKYASPGRNETHLFNLMAKLREQFFRHTGGIRGVVSFHAEFDAHSVGLLHGSSPL
jgi:hypothetical protein